MFDRLELQMFDVCRDNMTTIYKIAFPRLSPGLQQTVLNVFTSPRKPAEKTAGAEFYKLSVEMEDGTRYGAEYNEDAAQAQDLDMIDQIIREIEKCHEEDQQNANAQ